MESKKTKKNILVILGMFVLIFIVVSSFQKISFNSTRDKEKQVKGEIIVTGHEIPAQGIIKNLGDLEITIFQAEEAEYYDAGDQENKKYYRVFLKISNWNQNEKQIISEMVLTDNLGNSYPPDDSIAFGSGLEKLGKWFFYPMVTVDGFIIFPAVDEKAAKMDLVIKNENGQMRFEFRK